MNAGQSKVGWSLGTSWKVQNGAAQENHVESSQNEKEEQKTGYIQRSREYKLSFSHTWNKQVILNTVFVVFKY